MGYEKFFGYTKPARLGKRFIADLIDGIVLIIILIVFWMTIGPDIIDHLFNLQGTGIISDFIYIVVFVFFISVLFRLTYGFGFEALKAQTPGKMFVDTYVITNGGEKVTPVRALVRNLFKLLYSIGLLYLLEAVMIYVSDRTIGDMIANTGVVDGSSFREKEHAKKRESRQVVSPIDKYAKCKKCGEKVPLMKDGSGVCPKCRTGIIPK